MTFHALMFQWLADVRSVGRLDDISRNLWQDHADGRIDDHDASAFAEAIQARRAGLQQLREQGSPPAQSYFPKRTRPNCSRKERATSENGRKVFPFCAHILHQRTEGNGFPCLAKLGARRHDGFQPPIVLQELERVQDMIDVALAVKRRVHDDKVVMPAR